MELKYRLLDKILDGIIIFFINTFCLVSWVFYTISELIKGKQNES